MLFLRDSSCAKVTAAFAWTVIASWAHPAFAAGAGSKAAVQAVEQDDDAVADTPREAAAWRYAQRSYPAADVPVGVYQRGHRAWRAMLERSVSPFAKADESVAQLGPVVGPAWTLLGPGPAAGDSGRNTAIAVDPTNSN